MSVSVYGLKQECMVIINTNVTFIYDKMNGNATFQ